jgi:hypothetical protein
MPKPPKKKKLMAEEVVSFLKMAEDPGEQRTRTVSTSG